MWRSEERLEFWLAGGQLSQKAGRAAWLQQLLGRRFATAVIEMPLDFPIHIASLDDSLSAEASVKDGFGVFGDWRQPPDKGVPELTISSDAVHQTILLEPSDVRRLPMPDPQRTRIQQARLIFSPNTQSIKTGISSTAIHTLEPIQDASAEVKDRRGLLLQDVEVRAIAQIAELPHRRKSMDVDNLRDSERQSFLHEAEVLKHIPPVRAELLAVFRHVPIEVISRLRFLADKKEILFSVPREPRRTHTRVHDMAAIRDSATQEIHMVPHRTQSRSVPLAT
jgi:hypothetical protein